MYSYLLSLAITALILLFRACSTLLLFSAVYIYILLSVKCIQYRQWQPHYIYAIIPECKINSFYSYLHGNNYIADESEWVMQVKRNGYFLVFSGYRISECCISECVFFRMISVFRRLRPQRTFLMPMVAMILVVVWVMKSQEKAAFELGPEHRSWPLPKINVIRKSPGGSRTAHPGEKIQIRKAGEQVLHFKVCNTTLIPFLL